MKKVMKRMLAVVMVLAMMLSLCVIGASAKSRKPIPTVLVPGFLCMGPDDLISQTPYGHYFGGLLIGNLKKELAKEGVPTLEVKISPLSSAWDRACEVYAYLVGGTVDYGAAHAKKYGHERYGRTFPGVYKKWSNKNPVNLLGHSLGAPTVRLLAYMLYYGCPEEVKADPEGCSDLFKGNGKNMVNAVTTLAGANNGVCACDLARDVSGLLQKDNKKALQFWETFFYAVGALTDQGVISKLFDPMLDQWGFEKKEGETFREFIARLGDSKAFKTDDQGYYDMIPVVQARFNKKYKDNPNCYYFAVPCSVTQKLGNGPYQVQTLNAQLFGVTADVLGIYADAHVPGGWKDAYYENDGVISTAFERAPFLGRDAKGKTYKEGMEVKRGQWYNMPVIPYEHNGVIGIAIGIPGVNALDMVQWYGDHFRFVDSLA